MSFLAEFLAEEDGAVTVDWVVLTAVLVTMILFIFTIITEAIFAETGGIIATRIVSALSLW